MVVESQTDRRPPQPSASARALDVGDAHSDDSGTTDAGNDKHAPSPRQREKGFRVREKGS